MPYKWVEPKVVIEYFGIKIYHAYRHDMIEDVWDYNFTTNLLDEENGLFNFDIRDLQWKGVLEYKHSGVGIYEEDITKALMKAIEHQILPLPTDENIKNPYVRGCFNWYMHHPGKFIHCLALAVTKADGINRAKLDKAYHHMLVSNLAYNWNTVRVEGEVVDEPTELNKKKSDREASNPGNGCFFWYTNRSGSFVTHIANAIQLADLKNLELIKKAYPQMVAAYEMNDWNLVPKGFAPTYNSEPDHEST